MKNSQKNWYDDALLVNRDSDWWTSFCLDGYTENGYPMDFSTPETTVASLKDFIGRFKGYKITDLLINVNAQCSSVPSEVMMWYGEKWKQTSENGIPVDYSDFRFKDWYRVFVEHGIDALQVMLDELKSFGMRTWLSFRMNDCHCPLDETSFLRSDYYYYAKSHDYMIGRTYDYGHYTRCLDYAIPEIREYFLRYIEECLGKYDTFGIELDFMREPYCFDIVNNKNGAPIMNEFVRQARALVDAAAERYGHPIKLMIRVPRSLESSMGFGFDCRTWVEENLVDALVPTPRWRLSDSGIPVEEWKALVGDKPIAIFPGIEMLNLNFSSTHADQVRGYAAAWYAQDADGLYTFNFFGYPDYKRDKEVWMLRREDCVGHSRRFTVTCQDLAPVGIEPYNPLPMNIDGDAELPLQIGAVRAADRVDITFAWDQGEAPAIFLNGLKPDAVRTIDVRETDEEKYTGEITQRTECAHAAVASFTGLETSDHIVIRFEGQTQIGFVELNIIVPEE